MSESIKIDVSKAKAKDLYKAINAIEDELHNATTKDARRMPHNIAILLRMADGYVAQSTDTLKVTRNGNPSLKPFSRENLLHKKSTWEIMGISQGRLPSLHNPDGSEACMTMNGLPVDLTDDKTIHRLDQIRNYLLRLSTNLWK